MINPLVEISISGRLIRKGFKANVKNIYANKGAKK